MSVVSIDVPGVVFGSATIEALRELLRRRIVSRYEALIVELEGEELSSRGASSSNDLDHARTVVAEGTEIDFKSVTITASDASRYEWSYGEEPEWGLLDGCTQVAFALEAYANYEVYEISVEAWQYTTTARITAPADEIRAFTEDVRQVLVSNVDTALLGVQDLPFKVFIGHGGDRKWEQVKLFIEAAGYEVEAFESEDRTGSATLEIVQQMIRQASVAVMVMTGVDKLDSGQLLARQNVVHEIGLAQGILGVQNTLVLLEQGCQEFSNIAGLTQIRFENGQAHTTRESVLAALANRRQYRQDNPRYIGGC